MPNSFCRTPFAAGFKGAFRTRVPDFRSHVCAHLLSGPTATIILSRYTLSHYVFQHLEGVAEESRHTPLKGPCSTYLFNSSALEGGIALQAASWKVSQYQGGCGSYTVACRAAMGHLRTSKPIPQIPFKLTTARQTQPCGQCGLP